MAWNNQYYPQYGQTGAMPGQLEAYKQQYQMPQYAPPQNPIVQAAQSMAQPDGTIIWVRGIMETQSYTPQPGKTMAFWDVEKPIIYVKKHGDPRTYTLQWTECNPEPPQESSGTGNFATVDAVRDLENRLAALAQRIEEIAHREGADDGK